MNFGRGLFDWGQSNFQDLVLFGLMCLGLWFFFEKKFSKIVGLIVIGILAVGFVFATTEVKDVFVNMFKQFFK